MDPTASISGIASGVQWRDLIDQMMQVERRPAMLLESRIATIQTRSAAWLDAQNRLTAFRTAAQALNKPAAFRTFSAAVAGGGLTASASSTAAPGSYALDVVRLAAAEKLGGRAFASASSALGQEGELWINGRRIEVGAGDSLNDVALAINAANTGASATRVSAAVVNTDAGAQLVLTSQQTGAAGIDLVDGVGGVLRGLGLLDGTTSLKHGTSNGARSDAFTSATTAINALRGMAGPTSGTVTIGAGTGNAFQVALDLTAGLGGVADAINTAAAAASSSVTASVVQETVNGETVHRLDIRGTTSFEDANGVLEALGVLEGGRGAETRSLRAGAALQEGEAAATGASALTAVGSALGDTFTVNGTRRDGSVFTLQLEVTDGVEGPTRAGHTGVATLDDVLAVLNGASGFDGAATATISDGRLVLTETTAGASQLGLGIVAHNQGGGNVDFSVFEVETAGRARQIVAGQDAEIRVDGVRSTHRTNNVTGAIAGVSLTLTGVVTGATVTVSRNDEAAVKAVKDLVTAYNNVAAFVSHQFAGGEGTRKPLSADATLRAFRNQLADAMRHTLAAGVAGSWTRLGDVGITIQRDGTFALDEARLREGLASDPQAMERLFGVHASTAGAGLTYVGAGDKTRSGTYDIAISSHATVASAAGAALSGPYAGGADTLRLTDLGSGKTYRVELAPGLTGQALVDAVNAEMGTIRTHTLASATGLRSDGEGTGAGAATAWADVHGTDGVNAGVVAGDTITISGRRADGTTFYETLAIADPATQTVGELRDRVQALVGPGATVALTAEGRLQVTAVESGSSLLQVTISSDNEGGGTLELGLDVATEGRGVAGITAALDQGGALTLSHADYGSATGFRVAYDTGDAEAWLGLGASGTEYRGSDVAGTIGGYAATGAGRTLTGAAGTAVDQLMIRVEAGFAGGSVTFSRGIASQLDRALEPMLGKGAGSIASIIEGLDGQIKGMNDRIEHMEDRLVQRREQLIRRFTAMEQAMAVAQSQSSWLMAQINGFSSYSGRDR